MLSLLAHRGSAASAAAASASAAATRSLRAHSRSLFTKRAASGAHAHATSSAIVAPAAAHAAAASASRVTLLPLQSARLPQGQRAFSTDAPAEGEAAEVDDTVIADEDDGEPPNGPNVPLYSLSNVDVDLLADDLLEAPLEEADEGIDPSDDASLRYGEGEAYAREADDIDMQGMEAELQEGEQLDDERVARMREQEMLNLTHVLQGETEGRDDEAIENTDEIEEDSEQDLDPLHVEDDEFSFAQQEVDREGQLKEVFIDKMGRQMRHKDEYDEGIREEGEDYAGYSVDIRSKEADAANEERDRSDPDEDYDEEDQQETLEYDFENDPDDNWVVEDPLATRNPAANEVEYLNASGADPRDKAKAYRIGGDELPPTVWQGRNWITFPRTWENIKKNGKYPSEEEVEQHLKDVLGAPRPPIPVNPELPAKPQEYVWAPNLGPEHTDASLLMTEAEWKRKSKAEMSPRSWYVSARIQYRRKLHMVRAKYLAEYKHVKALHDANIQARWDQQMENRRARLELAQRVQLRHAKFALEQHSAAVERRRRQRVKARFTRLNKEMKTRRHKLHMLNYMLKERERHWIQPTLDATSGAYVPNKNLTPKIFDTQSDVVGFWPKHPAEERKEKADEFHRRKQAKLDA